MAKPSKIPKGARYGRLTIIKEVEPYISVAGNKSRKVKCKCDCGNVIEAHFSSLKNGNTASCRCLNKEKLRALRKVQSDKSGVWHPLNKTWRHIIDRCYNKNCQGYPSYGGRGIRVCKEWRYLEKHECFWNFVKWAKDNGWYEGCGLTIDRIKNNKKKRGYSPENCRWATKKQQARNTRRNILITYKNKKIKAFNFYELKPRKIKYHTFTSRLELGWSIKKAINTPLGYR